MDVSFMAFSRLAFGHWEGQPLYALADLGIRSAWPSRAAAPIWPPSWDAPPRPWSACWIARWRRSCWFARPAATATVN